MKDNDLENNGGLDLKQRVSCLEREALMAQAFVAMQIRVNILSMLVDVAIALFMFYLALR